ncbi:hypothetical protein D3C71_861930 [compost metagenome]
MDGLWQVVATGGRLGKRIERHPLLIDGADIDPAHQQWLALLDGQGLGQQAGHVILEARQLAHEREQRVALGGIEPAQHQFGQILVEVVHPLIPEQGQILLPVGARLEGHPQHGLAGLLVELLVDHLKAAQQIELGEGDIERQPGIHGGRHLLQARAHQLGIGLALGHAGVGEPGQIHGQHQAVEGLATAVFIEPAEQVQPEPLMLARLRIQFGFALGEQHPGGIQHHCLFPQPAIHQLILRHVAQLGIESRVELVGRVGAVNEAALAAAGQTQHQIPGHGVERPLAQMGIQRLQPAIEEQRLPVDEPLDRVLLQHHLVLTLGLELLHLAPHPPGDHSQQQPKPEQGEHHPPPQRRQRLGVTDLETRPQPPHQDEGEHPEHSTEQGPGGFQFRQLLP